MNRRDELAITVLRIVSEGNLGADKTGYFAKLDSIIEEIGDKQDTESIINNYLIPKKYVRKINDMFKEKHGYELEYTAYQITQLGRTFMSSTNTSSSNTIGQMKSGIQDDTRISDRLAILIADADNVLSTHVPNPPNVIGFPTLDTEKYMKWKASAENIIQTICGKDSSYLDTFQKETKSGAHKHCVEAGRGILLAVEDDLNAGLSRYVSENNTQSSEVTSATIESDVINLKINQDIYSHVRKYLEAQDYFHAVEESYKVVREKLRDITGMEKATEAFSMSAENKKYHKLIFGNEALAGTPQSDFYRGVGYLNLAIQFLRNEKSHTLATTMDKNLALHYISLASLAYDLISGSNEV